MERRPCQETIQNGSACPFPPPPAKTRPLCVHHDVGPAKILTSAQIRCSACRGSLQMAVTLYDSTGNDHLPGDGGNDQLRAFRGGDDVLDGGDFRSQQQHADNFRQIESPCGGPRRLASLMAVYFDRPATVFDEAPFEKSADSKDILDDPWKTKFRGKLSKCSSATRICRLRAWRGSWIKRRARPLLPLGGWQQQS
jgi:hypothetical protein